MDISIIIPAYQRRKELIQCLDSIFEQDYPKDRFEVIVINDGPDEEVKGILKEMSGSFSNLRYFFQQHKGPAAARNLGIKEAKAEIIGFSDTDCVLGKDWIRKMLEAHRLNKDAAAIGGLTKAKPGNIKAQVSQSLSDGAIETNINGRLKTIFFPTCNVSLKKQYIDKGFNELFSLPAGEDLEFFWRLYKKGNEFIYIREIEVLHNCHSNFKSFLKQAYMYGRGNYLAQYIHKDHPLLKEVNTGNNILFFLNLVINFIKIPRFSYSLGRRLILSKKNFNFFEKLLVYIYFVLHKIMYLLGNIAERLKISGITKESLLGHYGELEAVSSKPEFIILDLTHRCNLQCNICEIRKDGAIKEFSFNEVKDLIIQAKNWGIDEFVFSGGEPLIREDIFELLDFVKGIKYHVGILSNGILLNEILVNKLAPYLISNTLSLSISIDALTPAIHDDIRGGLGCFEKTVKGLRILSELKTRHPSVNFNTISIILNANLEELLPLSVFLKSLNVNSIQFQALLANNLIMKERSSMTKYWIPKERFAVLDKVVESLIEFKRQNISLVRNSESNLNLVRKYFRSSLVNSDVKCFYADKVMLIANNGDVTTCFDCYGNVRKNSLSKIHVSSLAAQARQRVKACLNPCLLPCFCDWQGE